MPGRRLAARHQRRGNNKVSVADLLDAFEAEGYGAVRTYVNSGNVLIETYARASGLEDEIEAMLERWLGGRPDGGGALAPPVAGHCPQGPGGIRRATRPLGCNLPQGTPHPGAGDGTGVELREGVDQAWLDTGVLYFARLSARRTQSKMRGRSWERRNTS
jgi:hypothetical protein